MKTKTGPVISCICCRKDYPTPDAFNRHAPACAAKHPHMNPDNNPNITEIPIVGTVGNDGKVNLNAEGRKLLGNAGRA